MDSQLTVLGTVHGRKVCDVHLFMVKQFYEMFCVEEIWLVCVAELVNRGGKRIGRDVCCVFADARFSKEDGKYETRGMFVLTTTYRVPVPVQQQSCGR